MNQNIWKDFISLLYPETCLICKQRLVAGEVFTCVNCFLLLSDNQQVDLLADKFVAYKDVIYAKALLSFHESDHVQKLIHAIKYKGNQALAIYLGKLIAKRLQIIYLEEKGDVAPLDHFDFILPVPLHVKRYRQRGYNQSELLANGYHEISNIPVLIDQIERKNYTVSQTKKNKLSRWENTKDIYQITDSFCLHDKKVLLIDDVITTGATISGILDLLITHGVKSIGIISLASEK